MRILFVDDETLILNAVRRTLRHEGFEMFFTSDPLTATRIIGEQRIDVVVSDHMMPEMNGVELLALVRTLHHNTVRVMMTGQADLGATIRAVNEGNIHRFVEKPWNDVQLKRLLHEIARARGAAPAGAAGSHPGIAGRAADAPASQTAPHLKIQ